MDICNTKKPKEIISIVPEKGIVLNGKLERFISFNF